ncbi:hypothetical protein HY468_03155 [Candidatus Roizmanbacteria bacterium]|nr:hypothetical protein [Candidatus Roizmanbacteria bacterium]
MKKLPLDTSAYSHLLKGDTDIQKQIERTPHVYISSIVIGELLAAFKNGSQEINNRQILKKFIAQPNILVVSVNFDVAEVYAELTYALKRKAHRFQQMTSGLLHKLLQLGLCSLPPTNTFYLPMDFGYGKDNIAHQINLIMIQ